MSADLIRCEGGLNDEIRRFEIHSISALPVSRSKLQIIRDEQEGDKELKLVKEFVTRGWDESSRSILPEYFSRRSELTVIDDLLLIGGRIVIPQKLKLEMLHRIHDDGHLSLNKCRERVKDCIWWPRISKEIGEFIDRCQFCQTYRRRNKFNVLL